MPYTATITFHDGRSGVLAMPDLYDLIAGMGEIPSPEVTAVIQLLAGEGSLPRENLLTKLRGSAEHYVRLYRLAALCIAEPRFVLMRRRCQECGATWDSAITRCTACMSERSERVDERGPDELGPRDLTLPDLSSIYVDFFLTRAARIGPAPAVDAGGAAGAAHPGNGLSDDAEPVFGAVGGGGADL